MNVTIDLYILWIVIVFFSRSRAMITDGLLGGMLFVVVGLICITQCLLIYTKKKPLTLKLVLPYLFIIFGRTVFYTRLDPVDFFVDCIIFFPVLMFFLLPEAVVDKMLDKVKTIIALLVGVSFSLYLLDIVGVSIPILEYVYHGKDKIINYYYLYVSYPEDKFRYCGLFIEPGYNSLVLVCMILVNNFNFKLKSTWLYLMAFICTFSLGGYILFVVGYSMFLLIKQGSISRALFIMVAIVVTLGAVTFVSLSYNGGNNYFAEKIIMRLMIDDDNGIAGNNREGLVALPIIDSFFYSNSIWMGVGKDVFYKAIDIPDFDACSWRQFVIMYGAVYTIFLFVTSVFLLKRTTIKRVLPFFIVYWVDFIQHGDLFMGGIFLLMMYGCANVKKGVAYQKMPIRTKNVYNCNDFHSNGDL